MAVDPNAGFDESTNWGVIDPEGLSDFLNPNRGDRNGEFYDRDQGRKGQGYGGASVYDNRLDWYFPQGMDGDDSKAKWMADALDQQSAGLMREQWASDKNMYFPVLSELQGRLSSDYREGVADKAGNRGLAAGIQGQQMANRDLSRFGVELGGAQKRQFDSGLQRNTRLTQLSGRNLGRQQMNDAQTATKTSFTSDLARGVQSSGLGGIVQSNSGSIDRANAAYNGYQDAAAQKSAARSEMIGSIVGGVAMGAMMV